MLKKTVARMLFFGIGFGLSYWIPRPAAVEIRPNVECVNSARRNRGLQVKPNGDGCTEDGDSKIKAITPDPVRSSPKNQLTFSV